MSDQIAAAKSSSGCLRSVSLSKKQPREQVHAFVAIPIESGKAGLVERGASDQRLATANTGGRRQ